MKRFERVVLCASSALLLQIAGAYASDAAAKLAIVNKASGPVTITSSDPTNLPIEGGTVTVASGKTGNVSLDSSVSDPYRLFIKIAGTDACKDSPFLKYGALRLPLTGTLTLDPSAASKADKCKYSTTPPTPPTPGGADYAAYRELNVGEDYIGEKLTAISPLYQYLGAPASGDSDITIVTDSSNEIIKSYFNIDKYGNLILIKNIDKALYDNASVCKNYTGHQGKKICTITLTRAGAKLKLPLILNTGIYTKSVSALATQSLKSKTNLLQPKSSAGPVDLSQYFNNATGATYHFDSEKVNGGTPDATVVKISGINQTTVLSGTDNPFSISGHTLNFSKLDPGIYQINIKAVGDSGETAFETFYVNTSDNTNNAFKIGGHDFSLIYSYTHANPAQSMDQFVIDNKAYGQDIHDVNTSVLKQHPVTVLASEFAGPQYTNDAKHWVVNVTGKTDDDPYADIKQSAVVNGFSDDSIPHWFKDKFVTPFVKAATKNKASLVTVSPDLTFGQNVRAAVTTYNAQQLSYILNRVMEYAVNAKTQKAYRFVSGLNLDLEQGTDASYDHLFKALADRLAYHGMFFGYYEFTDKSFGPSNLAAMGPLGVALVSSYDVKAIRSFKGISNPSDISVLKKAFMNDHTCDHGPDDGQHTVLSWCNQSLTDTYAANQSAWTIMEPAHDSGEPGPVEIFNAHYSPVLPLSGTATNYQGVEIWNPDLSKLSATAKGGLVMTNTPNGSHGDTACSRVDFSNPNNPNLQKCLFASLNGFKMSDGKAMRTYTSCGNYAGSNHPIPLSKCIYVAAIPSAMPGVAGLVRPSQADYIKDTADFYNGLDTRDEHMVGYSLYALHNQTSAPDNGAFSKLEGPNRAIQEPWYVGFNANDKNDDPYYQKYVGEGLLQANWKAVANAYPVKP